MFLSDYRQKALWEFTRGIQKKVEEQGSFPLEGSSDGKTGRAIGEDPLKIGKSIKHLLSVRYNAFLAITFSTTSFSSYR